MVNKAGQYTSQLITLLNNENNTHLFINKIGYENNMRKIEDFPENNEIKDGLSVNDL